MSLVLTRFMMPPRKCVLVYSLGMLAYEHNCQQEKRLTEQSVCPQLNLDRSVCSHAPLNFDHILLQVMPVLQETFGTINLSVHYATRHYDRERRLALISSFYRICHMSCLGDLLLWLHSASRVQTQAFTHHLAGERIKHVRLLKVQAALYFHKLMLA